MPRKSSTPLGNLPTSAAMLGIDTCQLEGIEPNQYDALLGLENVGLAPLRACAVGYRASDDAHATMPKVRFKAEEVIVHL